MLIRDAGEKDLRYLKSLKSMTNAFGKAISKDLLENCISNQRDAQKELYTMLLPYLNSVCRRYLRNQSDLNDALQEVFIKIFTNIEKFDDQKGNLGGWCTTIAINTTISLNKQVKKHQGLGDLSISKHTPRVDPDVFSKFNTEELMNFIQQMPSNYLEVFMLNVVDGYKHNEISELLGISEELSRKRLSRSRKWIEDHVDNGSISFMNLVKVNL